MLHNTALCEAAKRARLERIVRQGTEVSGAAMFLGISSGDSGALSITVRRPGKNLRRRLDHPKSIPESISRARTFDLLSPKTGLDVTAAKDGGTGEDDQVARTHKRNSLVRCLTPELSRDAQRPSGVLHDNA